MSVVIVTLTHSASKMQVPEKRLALTQTIQEVKGVVMTHFGTSPDHCRLELYDDRGVKVESDMQNEKQLGYYQCRDAFRIHVVDLQPAAVVENYDDVSKVEKFEISEDEYKKRGGDQLRAFKEKMQQRKLEEMEAANIPIPEELTDDSFKAEAEMIEVGSRCQCAPGDRLGTVRFVGRISTLKPGYWIGVEFDEPTGKSNGTVKGVKVFECQPLYGGFLRPAHVEVGDFPPEDF